MLRGLRFVHNAIRPNVHVAAASPDIHVDRNVPVRVRDGTMLRVNVFRPKGAGPFPVIMSAHPYGKDKIPAKTRSGRGAPLQSRLRQQPHPVRISAYTSWEAPDPKVGYARDMPSSTPIYAAEEPQKELATYSPMRKRRITTI